MSLYHTLNGWSLSVDSKLCNRLACVFTCPLLYHRHSRLLTYYLSLWSAHRQADVHKPRPARSVACKWASVLASYFRGGCCGFHVSVGNRPETANRACLLALQLKLGKWHVVKHNCVT